MMIHHINMLKTRSIGMTKKNKPKFKPNVQIQVALDKWEPIRLHLKAMNIRHSPFHRNWRNYVTKLEANENQLLMLRLHGDIVVEMLQS